MNEENDQLRLITRTIARVRVAIVAVVSGMVGGFGLFAATVWLLIKGGPNVGQNLALLGAYYPGYTVSWLGSLVGLFYGALTGAALGGSVAWFYNLLSRRRLHRARPRQA